jgi:dihydroneopterin aldolase
MTIHKTKPQTFMVDVNVGAEIQLLLANARVKNKVTYTSISDFVNQAIKEKLAKEAKK